MDKHLFVTISAEFRSSCTLESLIDSGDARYAAAGEYDAGAKVWMLLQLPNEMEITMLRQWVMTQRLQHRELLTSNCQ